MTIFHCFSPIVLLATFFIYPTNVFQYNLWLRIYSTFRISGSGNRYQSKTSIFVNVFLRFLLFTSFFAYQQCIIPENTFATQLLLRTYPGFFRISRISDSWNINEKPQILSIFPFFYVFGEFFSILLLYMSVLVK